MEVELFSFEKIKKVPEMQSAKVFEWYSIYFASSVANVLHFEGGLIEMNFVNWSGSAENLPLQANFFTSSGYRPTSFYPQQVRYSQGQPGGMMPADMDEQMQEYALKKMLDIEVDSAKTQNRMAVAEHKNQLAMLNEEFRAKLHEERYERKQLTVLAVSVNSDGYFEIERISPDGSRRHSASICNQRNFRGTYFYSAASAPEENILQITWQGTVEGIILSGSKMTAQWMGRELSSRGVCFRIPRRQKLEILEEILGYIIENAQEVEVPQTIGWTRNSLGAWQFEPEICNTLAGMLGKLYIK